MQISNNVNKVQSCLYVCEFAVQLVMQLITRMCLSPSGIFCYCQPNGVIPSTGKDLPTNMMRHHQP